MSANRLPPVRAKDAVRALEKAGFEKWRQKGSHLTMYRPSDGAILTVPMHFAQTVPRGTLRAILRSAHLSVEQFRNLL
jgi:predicted RNA binding protein YcfA (HicA-like mRNA interferase family)